ncbi:TraB/GumN family protein [Merismopedia glauca]|nr:TraB/GumN family protein [Merismopedia glauca]
MKISLAWKTIPLAIAAMVVTVLSNTSLAEKPTEKSLLWEITGPGITQPSYLFGTIHTICPDRAKLSQPVQTALARTKQLYLELDLDDPNFTSTVQNNTKLPPGQTLKTLLGDQNYGKVSLFFQQNSQISLDNYLNLKPFFLTKLSTDALLKCNTVAIDSVLLNNAQERQVEVLGLEEFQDQVNAVDKSGSDETVAAQVLYLVNNKEQVRQIHEQLISYYIDGDIVSIREKFFNAPAAEKGKTIGDTLIDSRNQTWIPKIVQAAKTKATFFGVGSGHLAGDRGVISLLRDAGYTVKPIRNITHLSTVNSPVERVSGWASPQEVGSQQGTDNQQHKKPAW